MDKYARVFSMGASWVAQSNIKLAEREACAIGLKDALVPVLDAGKLEKYLSRGIEEPLAVSVPDDVTVEAVVEGKPKWPKDVYRVKIAPIFVTQPDIGNKPFELRTRICGGDGKYHKFLFVHERQEDNERGEEPELSRGELVQYGTDIRKIQKSVLDGFFEYVKDHKAVANYLREISKSELEPTFMTLPLHAEFLGNKVHDDILTLSDGRALFARYSLDSRFESRFAEYLRFLFLDESSDIKHLMEGYMENVKEAKIRISPKRNYVVYNNNEHSRPIAVGKPKSSRTYRAKFLGPWLSKT